MEHFEFPVGLADPRDVVSYSLCHLTSLVYYKGIPLITHHFQDRFNDQPWLIYDAHRHYGYYYDGIAAPIRITFEDEAAVPFDLNNGKLNDDVLSENDKIFQDLWRTYFKAICIKERMNPKKQLSDMPRRYWRYMTEKNEGDY